MHHKLIFFQLYILGNSESNAKGKSTGNAVFKSLTKANKVGMISVLINRSGDRSDYGQIYTIISLRDVLNLVQFSPVD